MEWLHFIDTPVSLLIMYIFIQRDFKAVSERISRLEGFVFKEAKGT